MSPWLAVLLGIVGGVLLYMGGLWLFTLWRTGEPVASEDEPSADWKEVLRALAYLMLAVLAIWFLLPFCIRFWDFVSIEEGRVR